MNIRQPVILFSVDRGNPDLDKTARLNAHIALGRNGIPHKEVTGTYKGKPEVSFLIADDRRSLPIARRLASWNGQDTLMRVDANGYAYLESTTGEHAGSLGPLRAAYDVTGLCGYTTIDGQHFVAGYSRA